MNALSSASTLQPGDRGASAVEYGLLVAAIAAVIVSVVFGMGLVVKNAYSNTSNCYEAETAATC